MANFGTWRESKSSVAETRRKMSCLLVRLRRGDQKNKRQARVLRKDVWLNAPGSARRQSGGRRWVVSV